MGLVQAVQLRVCYVKKCRGWRGGEENEKDDEGR